MQISRRFLWCCVATTFFSFSLAAQDSDAQSKARQALEQKIKDTQGQPPAVIEVEPAKPPPPPAPVPMQTPPPKQTPPAKQTPPPKTAAQPKPAPSAAPQFMPLPESTSPQAADKLDDALHQKEMEMDAQRPVQPVNAERMAPVAHPAPTQVQAKPASTSTSTAKDKPSTAKLSRAETKTKEKPAPSVQKGKPVVAAAAPPPPGPPTGLSLSKEQRLADLNRQYDLDKVTPEEYHKERAKILSEP